MPGHDHHLQFVYQTGDLNSPSALYNWACPVDRDDSEDITSIFKRLIFKHLITPVTDYLVFLGFNISTIFIYYYTFLWIGPLVSLEGG